MTKVLPPLLLPLLLSLMASDPALAQDVRPSIRVTYADLNLQSGAGVTTLNRRLSRAISTVCGGQSGTELGRQSIIRRCRRDTRAQVETQLVKVLARASQTGAPAASMR